MSRGRPRKIADLIQRELADLLRRELHDPRVGMVTLTAVDVSPDLSHAKVFFTLLEKEKQSETTRALQRAAGFLRSKLAQRMKMYTTPELRFSYDESVARGDHLSQLIDSVVPREPPKH
ncbi:MAG: 30S ribosome-binding factor RbfA [Betaproteobacteria bacterium]|nr:30S ribosome-binding factor RbfA [Betaproteobacteria bacterium]MSQ87961.1 30S ribosome-binding factor RbfA [Betaproteobacteria bacterium]